ncbi:MAG: anti-sigma factor [Solirubrobacterales bacterium]|nr:anti-sigma factor [Solirubrobacterales bacterium]MBV9808798.1 anti-sigma factor [Solirubrobacterales bacterium]
MSASDNDRISYLSGEPVTSLTAQERAELDELRTLLETPAAWVQPDPGLEDLVVSAVAREAEAERASGVARGAEADRATAPHEAAPPVRRRFSLGALWRRRPVIALGGLATAAAAIVVALVIALNANSSKPLQFAMVVSGTPLAPAARGSGTLTKTESGWRVELKVTGLPHLANGRYYQAWLKNSAGILVPIGTFNDAQNVTLWSGAPVTQFRTFTVTRQLANGNPTSSGQRVLVGIAHPVH